MAEPVADPIDLGSERGSDGGGERGGSVGVGEAGGGAEPDRRERERHLSAVHVKCLLGCGEAAAFATR